MDEQASPLEGLRVIDCATMMAAPWAATYLADYGAEVIKIEHPESGDQVRKFGAVKDGVGLFWKTLSRNKQSLALNLNNPHGKAVFLKLIAKSDVLIENFRPGTLEKWGLGWDVLSQVNPRLVLLRMTGFGQDGPYAGRGGFGTIAEGMSGFAYMNGYPDSSPTLPPIALADGVASAFAALAVMIALHERDARGSGRGQVIDICLYEPLMRLLEASIVEYSVLGLVPERIGNRIASAAPRNVYQCKDGSWMALSASSQPIAENLFRAIGRADMITDPRFADNPSRVRNVDELDAIIGEWMMAHPIDEALAILQAAGAVVGPVHNMAQVFQDPQVIHRQSLLAIADRHFGQIAMPNVFARFSRTPGQIRHTGPDKGEHNQAILTGLLGLSEAEVLALKENGAI